MKKTLLAVVLATGAAGVAQADTSVTLYGIIDAGVGYNRIKGPDGSKASRFGAVDGVQSGSRFGFRGTEDLGGGLRAVFHLESGFSPNDGKSLQGGRLFGRQATVGLESDVWGRLEFGRQKNLASQYFGPIDPFAMAFTTANMGTAFGSANTMRLDNMVQYQTPSFSGLKFGIGYSFNADDNDTTSGNNFQTGDNNRVVTAGLQYMNGPLTLAASYDRMNPDNSAAGGKDPARIQQYIVGAAYDFEVVKVSAAFSQVRDGWFVSTNLGALPDGAQNYGNFRLADGFRADSYLLGLFVPLGAHKVFASWQRADADNDRLTGDDSTTNIYSVGYTYDLSRRTNLYAYASYGDNYAFQNDLRSFATAVGLRHRF